MGCEGHRGSSYPVSRRLTPGPIAEVRPTATYVSNPRRARSYDMGPTGAIRACATPHASNGSWSSLARVAKENTKVAILFFGVKQKTCAELKTGRRVEIQYKFVHITVASPEGRSSRIASSIMPSVVLKTTNAEVEALIPRFPEAGDAESNELASKPGTTGDSGRFHRPSWSPRPIKSPIMNFD
jgi:hypothetical protein